MAASSSGGRKNCWTNGRKTKKIVLYPTTRKGLRFVSFWCEAVDLIPQGKRTPAIWWKFFGDPRFSPNLRFFGRTDLSISLSRAKFDDETDFEVRSAVAAPKPRQISEKRIFRSEIFADFFFFGVEKRNVRNRPKRVLAKFRTDPNHIRGVTKNFHRSPAEMN